MAKIFNVEIIKYLCQQQAMQPQTKVSSNQRPGYKYTVTLPKTGCEELKDILKKFPVKRPAEQKTRPEEPTPAARDVVHIPTLATMAREVANVPTRPTLQGALALKRSRRKHWKFNGACLGLLGPFPDESTFEMVDLLIRFIMDIFGSNEVSTEDEC